MLGFGFAFWCVAGSVFQALQPKHFHETGSKPHRLTDDTTRSHAANSAVSRDSSAAWLSRSVFAQVADLAEVSTQS